MLVLAEGCSSGNRKLTLTTKDSRLSQLQTINAQVCVPHTLQALALQTLCIRGWAAGLVAACKEPAANGNDGECDQVMAALEHNHKKVVLTQVCCR